MKIKNHPKRQESEVKQGLFKRPSVPLLLLIGITIVILDQVSKAIIMAHMTPFETKQLIPGLFNLTYITNTGVAFGFMAGTEKWRHITFQIIAFTALCGLVLLYKNLQDKSLVLFWGSALVFGGALGNLIDRVRYRHVIDFLDFYIGNLHWPAFNIADSAITIGGTLLVWHFTRKPSS
ncbi:MAG: signal peptidase II [Dissulfurimicrobium sp.]|uniref:signal peptidase II n=1 Tax=Dissulfurimicrobium TaxID=1769732 RepID=UPI001EDC224E|nr:signal peptidase II [Dissulfurimicrobium hydrothermale]UKL14074.1 signal peptidase II [Dissulfurimicrobium hydrothermale]